MRYLFGALLLLSLAACGDGYTTPHDPAIAAALHARLDGDRTRACIAAAVIDHDTRRAVVCADGSRGVTTETAFEIGSISKTMTAFLLADLIREGALSLSDPLAMHLPEGTVVPSFDGAPITLAHVVTHTAGLPALPPRMIVTDEDDPYASLTEEVLLGSLADVTLAAAPGTTWAYSNFGFMLLSYVIATTSGEGFEARLDARLFGPLGMSRSFIAEAPAHTGLAAGHLSTGDRTAHWRFPDRMAGVGGVRASLDDMVVYASAVLGRGDEVTVATLAQTLEPITAPVDGPAMGMGWTVIEVDGHVLTAHDGGTGGFSSLLIVDRAVGRAVVLLVDTTFINLGDDLVRIVQHLYDPAAYEMPPPRREAMPNEALLAALAGDFVLDGAMIALETTSGRLRGRVNGSAPITFGYDSYGDFFATSLEALIRPVQAEDGSYVFDLVVGGAPVRAERAP